MKKLYRIALLVLILALAAAPLAGCGGEEAPPAEEPGETGQPEEEAEETPAERKLSYVLYLKYADKPYLSAERFQTTLPPEDLRSPMEVAFDALVAYGEKSPLTSPLPEGTRLKSVAVSGKVVTVDLSQAFLDKKMPSTDGRVVIAAVVNTLLFNQEEADSVEIRVEGTPLKSYNGYAFEQPLAFFEDGLFPDK